MRLAYGLKTIKTSAIIILFLVAWIIPVDLGENRKRYPYVLTYTFENRGDEPYILKEEDATIFLFQSNRWQTVRITNTTHTVAQERLDIDKNRLAILDLPNEIAPHSSLTFSITYEIESVDRPKPEIDYSKAGLSSNIPRELVEKFCVETETYNIGDEEVQSLAHRLASEETTVLGVVICLLNWFIDNVSYSPFDVPRYPNETLAEGKGDCDDQTILFVTMCRTLGIPALLQMGCIFHEDIEDERSCWGGHLYIKQKGISWHGWALVYIPPWGWLPIDMTIISCQEPLTRITEAPEYDRDIITCLNLSRQEYIGDRRRSRDLIISSDLYIVMSEISVEEKSDTQWATVIKNIKEAIGFITVFLLSNLPILLMLFEVIMFFYCLSMLF